MQQKISLKVLPSEAADDAVLSALLAQAGAVQPHQISGYNILKKSIDARSRQVWVSLTVQVFIDEPYQPTPLIPLQLKEVHSSPKQVIIVGAGPAGLFAALCL